MALVRWEPFREIDSLQRDMNRLFERFLDDTPLPQMKGAFVPAAELHETPDAVHLKL